MSFGRLSQRFRHDSAGSPTEAQPSTSTSLSLRQRQSYPEPVEG
ncbi:hypothetical protein [Anaerolinea sp.]|nr:hypothetical protein [Anaerolinea sp.]